jgi:hypothetical protein
LMLDRLGATEPALLPCWPRHPRSGAPAAGARTTAPICAWRRRAGRPGPGLTQAAAAPVPLGLSPGAAIRKAWLALVGTIPVPPHSSAPCRPPPDGPLLPCHAAPGCVAVPCPPEGPGRGAVSVEAVSWPPAAGCHPAGVAPRACAGPVLLSEQPLTGRAFFLCRRAASRARGRVWLPWHRPRSRMRPRPACVPAGGPVFSKISRSNPCPVFSHRPCPCCPCPPC